MPPSLTLRPRPATLALIGLVVVAGACSAGTAGSAASLAASPSMSTSAEPTPTPTSQPTPNFPVALSRPTDIPTNGTCEAPLPCLGLLKPGTTYRTTVFSPRVTFTMPMAGWENLAEEGGIFQLLPISAPGDTIAFFREPSPTSVDGKTVSGAGASVETIAAWLASNDQLEVTPAKAVTVGGLTGVTLDLRVAKGATAHSSDCAVRVCVPIFTGIDPAARPTWKWDWGSAGLETQRLYLLTATDGVIAIFVDSLDGTTFAAMTAAADRILPKLRFG